MLTLKEKIGLQLKRKREEKKLTQSEVAAGVNFSIETVGKIERGVLYMSEEFLQNACKFFNVEESYFYTFSDYTLCNDKEKCINSILNQLQGLSLPMLICAKNIIQSLYELNDK